MDFSASRKDRTVGCGLYERIYFFLMVLYAGASTPYTQVLLSPIRAHFFSMVLPLLLTVVLLVRNPVSFKNLLWPAGLFAFWTVLQSVKYGTVYPMTLFYAYDLCLAYIIANVYRLRALVLFERYVTILSVVGLVFWFFSAINYDSARAFITSMTVAPPGKTLVGSLVFVTMSDSASILGPRNSGFAGEPGMYASLLCLAIFFCLIRTRFIIRRNVNFFVLLLALITTQSTTGYITGAAILMMYALNKARSVRPVLLALGLVAGYFLVSLPFIGAKLITYAYSEDSGYKALYSAQRQDALEDVFVPQRFDGMAFDLLNLISEPVLGYGIEDENSAVAAQISSNILLSEGIISIFSRFGVFMGALFLWWVFRSSVFLQKSYQYSGSLFFLALWAFLSCSYDLNRQPLFLSFWLLALFLRPGMESPPDGKILNATPTVPTDGDENTPAVTATLPSPPECSPASA
jgi:hypothetical protein